MPDIKTIIAKIINSWYKLQKPAAFVFVIVGLVAEKFLPQVACVLLAASSLIIMTVIFEIYAMLTRNAVHKVFSSFSEAISDIESALDSYIRHVENPEIKVLGIVLYHQWRILESYLLRILSEQDANKKCLKNLKLQFSLLDPSWPETVKLNKLFPRDAEIAISRIKSFASNYREQAHNYNWSIEIFTYQYTPHWFGILIGNDVLFLCRSYWEKGCLHGGSNSVEVIIERASSLESHKLKEFRGWLKQCQQARAFSNI